MSTWTPEREAELLTVGGNTRPVTQAIATVAAAALEVSQRSISSILRKMGVEVETVATRSRVFSEEQETALASFLEDNSGEFTYAEIAAKFNGGAFSAKQVQGKILSMEMTGDVKATPKVVVAKSYSDEEEATFVAMAKAGKCLEDIAVALDKSVASARGKALSLLRSETLTSIPTQRDKAVKVDPIDALGDISEMTVAEIALATDKTERGIKVIITRRGLSCKDYKAKAKKSD